MLCKYCLQKRFNLQPTGYIGEVLFGLNNLSVCKARRVGIATHDECRVVSFHFLDNVVAHCNRERPFIDYRNVAIIDVFFVQTRTNEGFGNSN
jgi:hypothetical protein